MISTRKTILDWGSRSDRPRYRVTAWFDFDLWSRHTHTRTHTHTITQVQR